MIFIIITSLCVYVSVCVACLYACLHICGCTYISKVELEVFLDDFLCYSLEQCLSLKTEKAQTSESHQRIVEPVVHLGQQGERIE